MEYRTLGRTGYRVSEIGFGAWGIGKTMWVGAEDQESLRALNLAVDQGLNFIDTAAVYGSGHSERLIGRLLKERSERLLVGTKIPPKNFRWPASGSLSEAFPGPHIQLWTEKSLRNLSVDRIDLIQLHVWNADWIHDNEWHDTFCSLREQAKIGAFGVSINDHDPRSALELVRSGKVDTVQVIYNIFDQSPEDELFPLCQQTGVGVIARVPLDEGGLSGRLTPQTEFPRKDWRNLYFKGDRKEQVYQRTEQLKGLLGSEAESLPELALRFCLHHPAVSTVIPGMRTADHALSNTSVSGKPRLSDSTLRDLRRHRWVRNFYP